MNKFLITLCCITALMFQSCNKSVEKCLYQVKTTFPRGVVFKNATNKHKNVFYVFDTLDNRGMIVKTKKWFSPKVSSVEALRRED